MGPKKHPLQTAADQAQMGVDTRSKFCACGTVISRRAKQCRRCSWRIAQARYQRTDKGKATHARYRATESGRRMTASAVRRRIFVGREHRCYAKTEALATVIRNHIRERLRVFKQGFEDREKAEGVSSGEVST